MSPRRWRSGGNSTVATLIRKYRSARKRWASTALRRSMFVRRDQAHVERNRASRTETRDLTLLQHPQQFHLQCQRQIAHLVEKQRAPVSGLEPACACLCCTRVCACFVAEQLGVDERLAESTAVDREERPGAAALLMQMSRDQLLTSTGFADDEHRRIGARESFDPLEQRKRNRIVKRERLGANRQRTTGRCRIREQLFQNATPT